MIFIMPINFTMGTSLVRVKVGGGGLRWIKAILFPMMPITTPTLVFYVLLHII
jgi:hypothetical protein